MAAETDVLSTAVHPPPKSVGELVFDDGSDNPITACLEAFPGTRRGQPALDFCPQEERKVG
jgi:hypothetical protein